MTAENHSQIASFIWGICNLLRGPYKRNEYRKVILPLTVLRRFDCLLEPTKQKVLVDYPGIRNKPERVVRRLLEMVTGRPFYNLSKLDFAKLLNDPDRLAQNLISYINEYSKNVREIIEHFNFEEQVHRMQEKDLLYKVIKEFSNVNLSPRRVDNIQMGYVFEELIRIGAEQANEEAGEHFTPREVIRLMVNLLLAPEQDLRKSHVVKTIYDPACGTGGMLSVAEKYIRDLNSDANPHLYGQDWNDESWAICKADMLIKGDNAENIVLGDTFARDGFARDTNGEKYTFDYMLANPPFGVEWKQQQEFIKREHDTLGYAGRFGAGLPRINDGSLLFLQHMLAKMRTPSEGGSRIAIVFSGSPLFTGDAGSGESSIRQWIIDSDWLEAVIALPDQLFYNTGISTYIWVLTNRKELRRKGKVQLIDARSSYVKMPKSLGNKRNKLGDPADRADEPDQVGDITSLLGNFEDGETRVFIEEAPITKQSIEKVRVVSKVFDNDTFGFRKVTIEQPLRLTFQATTERLARIEHHNAFTKLATKGKKNRLRMDAIRDLLTNFSERYGPKLYRNRSTFIDDLRQVESSTALHLLPTERKIVVSALGEREPSADICRDRKGDPEPDVELRDIEIIPIKEDIDEFFRQEIQPHHPDAWIDHDKTKVGYEIPLNRHFYQYEPPRPLDEIEADIKMLGREVFMIEQLQDRRTALISHAVTYGVPQTSTPRSGQGLELQLKDSGIDWLGYINSTWKVQKLKMLCSRSALYGANIAANLYTNSGIRFIRTTDITDSGELRGEGVYIPEELAGDYLLSDGDLLISRSGTIGRSFLYEADRHGPCAYAGYLVRFVPKSKTLARYVFWFTKSSSFQIFLKLMSISSTIDNVNGEKYANLLLPVPPAHQQSTIVDYLDRQTAEIDTLISNIEVATNRWKEYRSALVTAAVTGAIDVGGVTPVVVSEHGDDTRAVLTQDQSVGFAPASTGYSAGFDRQSCSQDPIGGMARPRERETEASKEGQESVDRVHVAGAVLRWARERANYSLDRLSGRFPKIELWERGESQPTLKQLEAFAKATSVPIGFLFLPRPPVETMPIPDFRTVANVPLIHPSPELFDIVYLCQRRQNWYRDFVQSVDESRLEFVGSARICDDIGEAAASMRVLLGFDLDHRAGLAGWKDALRHLIEQAEARGILIMVSGIIDGQIERRLDPLEFRCFALSDQWAPLVFVNGADTKAAQMFALAYAVAYLWLGKSGISDADARGVPNQESERWCSRVAAELLVPLDALRDELDPTASFQNELDRLSLHFRVSTLVILRRIYDVGRLSPEELRVAYDAEVTRLELMREERGGNFYLSLGARVSRRFARALVVSTLEGYTGFTDAFRMLGLKTMASFDALRRSLEVRY